MKSNMKSKIAGMMILLAGTATVFAATHKNLAEDFQSDVDGAAGFVENLGQQLGLEMEYVGLQPGNLYVARLESSACEQLPQKMAAFPNGISVAMFVEPNTFGSYSNVMSGLPADARLAKSIALYKENGKGSDSEIMAVHCQNIG